MLDEEEARIAAMFSKLRKRSPDDHFVWSTNPGFNFTKHNPDVIGDHLMKIAGDNGDQFSTRMIVNDALNPDSPLFPLFEHDIEIAADNWWQVTARSVVNTLRIVHVIVDAKSDERSEIKVSAFANVRVDGKRTYVPINVVARVPDMRKQAIARMMYDARLFIQKARELGFFASVVDELDTLLAAYEEEEEEALAEESGDLNREIDDMISDEGMDE